MTLINYSLFCLILLVYWYCLLICWHSRLFWYHGDVGWGWLRLSFGVPCLSGTLVLQFSWQKCEVCVDRLMHSIWLNSPPTSYPPPPPKKERILISTLRYLKIRGFCFFYSSPWKQDHFLCCRPVCLLFAMAFFFLGFSWNHSVKYLFPSCETDSVGHIVLSQWYEIPLPILCLIILICLLTWRAHRFGSGRHLRTDCKHVLNAVFCT